MALLFNSDDSDKTADDIVSQSYLYPDHSGWLVDQESGKRRWCIIADMLLCVFPDPQKERPVKVIMLPGHKVKAMVFTSAKPDSLTKVTDTYQERLQGQTVTISGIQKHQFAIYSPGSGKRCLFGADDKQTVDKWVAMITVATNLDQDLFKESEQDSNDDVGYVPSVSQSCRNVPIETRQDVIDGFQLTAAVSEVSDECGNQGNTVSQKSSGGDNSENINKSDLLGFTKVQRTASFGTRKGSAEQRHPETVLRDAKRSNRKNLHTSHSWSMGSQESLHSSVSGSSIESKESKDSFSRIKSLLSKNTIKTLNRENSLAQDVSDASRRGMVTRSLEERIKSIPLPASIANALLARRASADAVLCEKNPKPRSKSPTSSLRIKMFGTRSKREQDNITVGDHSDQETRIRGWLHHKQLFKWSRIFCVVSQCQFWAYKSDYSRELPDFVLPLKECTVQPILGEGHKNYGFKICHLNAKSTYLAASCGSDFEIWTSVLQDETRTWEDGYAMLKSQPSCNSLLSNNSTESNISSRTSLDSFLSHSSLISQTSSNLSTRKLADDKNNNEVVRDEIPESPVDVDDGFVFVERKTDRWQPPRPAHGLDLSTSSLGSFGETINSENVIDFIKDDSERILPHSTS